MTGPARSSDKLTMGSILKSLLHTSLPVLVYACTSLSVLVLVYACACLFLWCLMPWNITKRRCPLSYSGSDESKRWWIVAAMYLCAFLFSFLMLFASGLTSTHISREKHLLHVHRILLQENTKTRSVQWTEPVGQLVRCLYVVEARSSVLSVTPSALAASIYQPAGAFSHTKAYSWVQILRKDIKAYISIPEVFFRIHTFLRHFYMLQAILRWLGRPQGLLGFFALLSHEVN